MRVINYVIYALIRGMLLGARLVPMGFTFWWLKGLARLAYRLARRRRALMLWNLESALGDQFTPEQREEIARQSFENMFLTMGEFIHMDTIIGHWQKHFTFEGVEILERLIEQKKGMFVVGGHFGAWLMDAVMSPKFPGIPGLNVVVRPLRNPRLQQVLEFVAGKFGGKLITTRGTGEVIEERVARGELVCFYMDQESRRDQGIFVKFFGREASSHVVPGYLAWKNNIPLIPGWMLRVRPGHFHMILREPLKYELTPDKDENNRRVTQLIADEVERTIREHPEQWLWAHNRWRRRPDGTKDPLFEKESKRSRGKARKRGDYVSSEDLAKKSEEK